MQKCLNCGSEIPNRNVYCNNQCQSQYQHNQRIEELENRLNQYYKEREQRLKDKGLIK